MANAVREIENRLEECLHLLVDLEGRINLRMKQLGHLRQQSEQCCSLSYSLGSQGNNRSCFAIIELEREIDKHVDRLVDVKKEMKQMIACVDDLKIRAELGRRYSECFYCE